VPENGSCTKFWIWDSHIPVTMTSAVVWLAPPYRTPPTFRGGGDVPTSKLRKKPAITGWQSDLCMPSACYWLRSRRWKRYFPPKRWWTWPILHSVITQNITLSVTIVYWRPYQPYICTTNKQSPWYESASELYQPSDRRLSEKWLPTFADRGCHVVSVTDPYGRTLGFLDRSRYFSIK
jgi:hypothetical protein